MLMFQKATFEEFLYFSLNSCVQDEILEKMHQPRSLGRYTPMFWGNAIEYKWCIHLNYWHLIDKGRGRQTGGEGKKCTAIPWCLAYPTYPIYILKVLRVYPSMHNCTYIFTVFKGKPRGNHEILGPMPSCGRWTQFIYFVSFRLFFCQILCFIQS